jgi:DNA polymerase-3 subunit epsilon
MTRQIILDTETTGLDPKEGHRIIEIGCVEMRNRRLTGNNFHYYLQPDREIDAAAEAVHGISSAFLADKPRFANIMEDLLTYLRGAELIIHNAPFDIGFLNHELRLVDAAHPPITAACTVTDTLVMARRLFPGQRASLDALCKRYEINNAHRTLHGALLDSEILADVYLAMTGGQVNLMLGGDDESNGGMAGGASIRRVVADVSRLRVITASEDELAAHVERLAAITKAADGKCLFTSVISNLSKSTYS